MFTSLHPGAIGISANLSESLELASSCGFEALDIPVGELTEIAQRTSVHAIREQFARARVRPGGWGLPVDFRGAEDVYQAGLAQFPAYAKIAQELGSPWCATWILPFSDQLDYDANMDLHVKRLRPIAKILADHGCRFGLEFVGPITLRKGHRHEFIATMPQALDLGNRIGTGNTGLLLDCWHWYTSHATVEDIKRLRADQVVYVHVNDAPANRAVDEQIDNQRLLPGASGVIDIAGFLKSLQHIGYDGPVVVEPFNAELTALPNKERVKAVHASLAKIWDLAGLSRPR